jgi:hypothetical protein
MWLLPPKVSALMAFEAETFVGNSHSPFWLVIMTPCFVYIHRIINMLRLCARG